MTMTLEELRTKLDDSDAIRDSFGDEDATLLWEAIDSAIKERDELRSMHMQDCDELLHVPSQDEWRAMMRRVEAAESELAALKQRIAKGRYVRSTRNGVIRTPVGWCEPNTDYTIIMDANPPTE